MFGSVGLQRRVACALSILFLSFQSAGFAQSLRGHGGPVRALAVSSSGKTLISGGFDQTAIVWDLPSSTAKAVLRKHSGAVNAVAALPEDRFATGGDDGEIFIWSAGGQEPVKKLEGFSSPVSSLAVSPNGERLAAGGWDGAIRIFSLREEKAPQVLSGHSQHITALAYLPDGTLVSADADLTMRLWAAAGDAKLISLAAPVNRVAIASHEIILACADGRLRFFAFTGEARGELETGQSPLTALAVDKAGAKAAAGSIDGRVYIFDAIAKRVERQALSPGLPVWALAYLPDGSHFFAAGGDGIVRRWDAATGELDGPAAVNLTESIPFELRKTRGAEVFRACVACHTISSTDAPRAGPTLHRVMGRPIATAPNYIYSEAFPKLGIVWTKETISKLFEIGPHAYTPGTKMPEQRLNAADRAALTEFLEHATR